MKTPPFFLMTIFVSCMVRKSLCLTVCSKLVALEWHLDQILVQMNLTLMENTCGTTEDCWGSHGGDDLRAPFNFPQICPLQLQHGDKLVLVTDETLTSYGVSLLNVSKDDFESCSADRLARDQFVFPWRINTREEVESKWLKPGHHYFIALHDKNTQLCKHGLRLNVLVKTQLCQASPLVPLCSGRGICQTDNWEPTYSCRCHHRYSGRFCEKFDPCLDSPCKNKGVCLSSGSAESNHRTYKCLCPPHFTGKN